MRPRNPPKSSSNFKRCSFGRGNLTAILNGVQESNISMQKSHTSVSSVCDFMLFAGNCRIGCDMLLFAMRSLLRPSVSALTIASHCFNCSTLYPASRSIRTIPSGPVRWPAPKTKSVGFSFTASVMVGIHFLLRSA